MATALHNFPSLPPISASKTNNKFRIKSPFKKTKRRAKPKPLTLPKLPPTVKRLIFSLLPPPLDLLTGGYGGDGGGGGVWPGGGSGGDWWFGKRRRSRLDFAEILQLILALSAGSVLGLNAKEARVFGLGISGLKTGAVCFLLGFVICFLICEEFVFGKKKRRRNWWTNWKM